MSIRAPDEPRRRAIYLLPNLLTTGCLFSGFYAIVAAIDGNFERAGIAVFIAMLFDGLDGRVARLTSTESAFGKEYDSLADMVAFGLAPAIVDIWRRSSLPVTNISTCSTGQIMSGNSGKKPSVVWP